MSQSVTGLHHVTAIAGDPQQNIDFYTKTLGLRLVKVTVNFDDPSSYHFYYGDGSGSPGTIMTFFSWPGMQRGRIGPGQVMATAFTIPTNAVDFWQTRLQTTDIPFTASSRFDEQVISLRDPDGLVIELVAHPQAEQRSGWMASQIPAEYTIRGLHAVTLWEQDLADTRTLLEGSLGFTAVGTHGQTTRFAVGDARPGTFVDVQVHDAIARGLVANGTVHHVAYRVADDADQEAYLQTLTRTTVGRHLIRVSPVMDREYFHSIYFREPGGVLFEIATDTPGFAIDEPPEELGTHLKLPPWMEGQRAAIKASLPPISVLRNEA